MSEEPRISWPRAAGRRLGRWGSSALRRLPQRRWIPSISRGCHGFGIKVRPKWWPPFAATHFLPPRYEVSIRNTDVRDYEELRLQVAVAPYAGSLEALPKLPNQWRPLVEYQRLGKLDRNDTLIAQVKVPTGALDQGTHVLRLHIMTRPDPTPRDQPIEHAGTVAWLREYLRVEPVTSAIALVGVLTTLLGIVVALVTAILLS